jgi:phage shock protein PspC (stress-responsive transcriptional regulator)
MKRVALINVLWLGVSLAVSLRYFFIVPTIFLSIALLLFLIAWFALPSDSKA